MKRWGLVTVLFYAAALVLLTVPGVLVSELTLPWSKNGLGSNATLAGALDIFTEWGYWVWLGVMVVGQALLLLVPVRMAARRPITRRPLLLPIVVASFLLGLLFLTGSLSALSAIVGDDAFKPFEVLHKLTEEGLRRIPGLWATLVRTGVAGSG